MSYNKVTPFKLGQRKKKDQTYLNINEPNQPHGNLPFLPQPVMGSMPQMPSIPKPLFTGTVPKNNTYSNLEPKRRRTNDHPNQHNDYNSGNKWDTSSMNSSDELERRRKRAERFNSTSTASTKPVPKNTWGSIDDEEDFGNLNAISSKSHKFDKDTPIVGRCQTLEKSYLRLTSEPNPELVRPLNILKQAYELIMSKYEKGDASYTYFCDQFKSIRQDLRVQMIENRFTIKVYQTHARIALDNNDLGEFNQCQSRLLILFESPLKKVNYEEFMSYLILYYILTENNEAITSLRLQLLVNYKKVYDNKLVQEAFRLANMKLSGDYHNLMRTASCIKGRGRVLINAFIEKEIIKALVTICKSYNQVSIEFLSQELKYDDLGNIEEFFKKKNLEKFVITKNSNQPNEYKYLDTKGCRMPIMQLYANSRKIDIKGQK